MNQNEEITPEDRKMIEAYLSFTEHYAEYIKQNDSNLHSRAVDFAMTFAEKDNPGIKFTYITNEKGKRTIDMNFAEEEKDENPGS